MLLGIWMMKLLDMACNSSKIHDFKILMGVLIHFANVKWTQNDLLNSDGHDFLFQISFFTWTVTEPPSFGHISHKLPQMTLMDPNGLDLIYPVTLDIMD
jgi:hypothetical protein